LMNAHNCMNEVHGCMQEGWRLAIAKRAKEELTNREAALRTQLMQERDHQLQVSLQMLL